MAEFRDGFDLFTFKFKLLDKFVINEFYPTFVFGVMVFTVLLVAGDLLFDIADLLIQSRVPFNVVVRLFLYRLPGVVVLTLPMAALLATILSFGKMATQSELTALKASGISFYRILRPIVLASIIVGGSALLFNETIVPLTDKAADNIMRYEVARQKPSLLKEQMFLREEKNGELSRVIYIGKLYPSEGNMNNVLIQEFEGGEIARIMTAKSGEWKEGEWWLHNGQVFSVKDDGLVEPLFGFERQQLALPLSPSQVVESLQNPKKMGAFELYNYIKLMKIQGTDVESLWVLLHLRLAVPWASVVLALVGASVGAGTKRSGSGMGIGVSIILVFSYYVFMSFCRSLGQGGYIPPLAAAWIPNIMFLSCGVFMVKKANR
jgi:lipopolysaccharide export system permease protein